MATEYYAYRDRVIAVHGVLKDGTLVVEAWGHGASNHVQAVPRGGCYLRVPWTVLRSLVRMGRVKLYDLPMIPADAEPAPPVEDAGKPEGMPMWRWRQLQKAARRDFRHERPDPREDPAVLEQDV